MLLDLWPIESPMAVVMNHDLAEQVVRPSKIFPLGVPKTSAAKHYAPLFGDNSIAMQHVRSSWASCVNASVDLHHWTFSDTNQ